MDASHSRRRAYISLLVISYSYVFGLASNLNISNDARGSKIEITNSRSSSTDYGTDMGKQYIMCTESNLQDPWVLSCKTSKDVVTRINFADYGNPSGKCEHYRHGNCGAKATMDVVKKNCLGKHNCVIIDNDEMFGASHCNKDIKFTVQYTCTKA
ncbi:unnamed protein product [Brassica oleracea var. botrytis]|uniref:SUEL-type lectin domain-containing protein n=1 Tax=Brassica oleracea TaxID=3712 RepID=A0A3P6BVK3_BRAOL|nr:unnamed protein product [Brassica oleracea]